MSTVCDRMIVYQDLKPKSEVRSTSSEKVEERQRGFPGSGPSSTVQLSRKWVLPPKAKSGRKPAAGVTGRGKGVSREEEGANEKVSDEKASDESDGEFNSDANTTHYVMRSPNYAEKRRKQNREAQRAYRERKANKLQDLQKSIDVWRDKCERLSQEVNLWRSRYDSAMLENRNQNSSFESRLAWHIQENASLKETVAGMEKKLADAVAAANSRRVPSPLSSRPMLTSVLENVSGSARPNLQAFDSEVEFDSNGKPSCSICVDGSCICDEMNAVDGSSGQVPGLRPRSSLSLSLSSNSNSHSNSYNQLFKCSFQDPALQQTLDNWKPVEPVVIESKKRSYGASKLPQFKKLKPSAGFALGTESSVMAKDPVQDGCGFCSELSTCVCRELEEDTKRGGCTGEPGTCSICQQDNGSKNFCENVVNFARSSSSSSLNNDEYIPINDAFQRIKKHMKNSNNQSLNNIRYDNLAIKGRKVQLKSVMDIIQDMNKNFI